MNFQISSIFFIILSSLSIFLCAESQDEEFIRKKAAEYVQSFNEHNAKALSLSWAEDGEYINPRTGETIIGRDSIEKSYQNRFQLDPNLKLKIEVSSITFENDDEAVLEGLFIFDESKKQSTESAFKAYFEKNNGQWVIGEIREVEIEEAPNQYEFLKELEWIIGDWIDQDDDDIEVESSYYWDESKNLIFGKFSVITVGKQELNGTQVFVWNPVKNKIQSWFFDSDGGFGESTWTKNEKSWVTETVQTLADGRIASSVNIYTPLDSNRYTWESTSREVGGELLEDIEPITIIKKKGTP